MKLLKDIGIVLLFILSAFIFSPIWIPIWLMFRKSPNANQINKNPEDKYRVILSQIFGDSVASTLYVYYRSDSQALIGFRNEKYYSAHGTSNKCEVKMPDFINPKCCHRISDEIHLYDNPNVDGIRCWFFYDRYANYHRTMMFIDNSETDGSSFKNKLAEETGLHLPNEARTIGYIDYSTMQLAGENIYFDLGNREMESLKTQLGNLCKNGLWEQLKTDIGTMNPRTMEWRFLLLNILRANGFWRWSILCHNLNYHNKKYMENIILGAIAGDVIGSCYERRRYQN